MAKMTDAKPDANKLDTKTGEQAEQGAEHGAKHGAESAEHSAKPAKPAKRAKPLSVDANQFIEELAKELQNVKDIKPPDWAVFVKTGAYKERPPQRKDWWHVRTAAVLRTVDRLGPIGTAKLRTRFGGKHSRGYKSERFAKGSGSILRKALQQLEKAGLIKQAVKGVHKGRVTTEKASSLMGAIALKVSKDK